MRIRRIHPDPYKAPSGEPAQRKRKARSQYEHHHQAALFRWAALNEGTIPELANLYAVPNAAKRSPAVAAMMKAEGLKAGVPDVFLAWPTRAQGRIDLPGLYIEMKTPGKKPTDAQVQWRNRLVAAGYRYVLAFDWAQAANTILEYLGPHYARHRVA